MSDQWKPGITRISGWSIGLTVYDVTTEDSFVWGTQREPTCRYVVLALGRRTFEWSWVVRS